MALYEVSFKIDYDYPFINITKDFPGLRINMWCLWDRELLEIPAMDEEDVPSLERFVRKSGHLVERVGNTGRSKIFLLKCTCDRYDSMWNIAGNNRFVDAPPAVYKDGWGFFRLITFEESNLKALFRDLNSRGTVELLSKRELPYEVLPSSMWVSSMFSDLTAKQSHALLKAHQYGYYSTPRSVTTDSIAKSLGVSRSTFEEHLRKAENKVMAAMIPYLQLFSNSPATTGQDRGGKELEAAVNRTAVL